MTELEKMERAKMYMDKLANGINPIDDSAVPDEDTINNVRLSRCFFYVSDVLRQVIENGGIQSREKKEKSAPKLPFSLTEEQKKLYTPSGAPITVSEIAGMLNECADLEKCKKLSHSMITAWLVSIGALDVIRIEGGKTKKRPTKFGNELGITLEKRTGMYGEYEVVYYDRNAQQFIVDNLEAITSLASQNAKDDSGTAENGGQVWTNEQNARLLAMFSGNASVPEMANDLKRTEEGIRARLKRLGLIENRHDI